MIVFGTAIGAPLFALPSFLSILPERITVTRLHPQGRWPEGPPSAAHVSLCLTFGTLKLHSSPLKPSKSGPQTSKTPTFGTLKLQISLVKRSKSRPQNLKIVHFWVPFLDRILNVSRAKFGVSRSQKELKMTQKCPNCFGIVRTDRQTHNRQTHIKILGHCAIGPSGKNHIVS